MVSVSLMTSSRPFWLNPGTRSTAMLGPFQDRSDDGRVQQPGRKPDRIRFVSLRFSSTYPLLVRLVSVPAMTGLPAQHLEPEGS